MNIRSHKCRMGFYMMVLAALLVLGCGAENEAVFSDSIEQGAWGYFQFELIPRNEIGEGVNDFQLKLRDIHTLEPIGGARLTVSALMPSMGHEAPEGMTQREMNAGDYFIEHVVLNMPGFWELRCRAESGMAIDEAAFQFHLH